MKENKNYNRRIEFVKKLLVANGFVQMIDTGYVSGILKYVKHEFVCIICGRITLYQKESTWSKGIILDNQPLKPLRDFIKLSNQK